MSKVVIAALATMCVASAIGCAVPVEPTSSAPTEGKSSADSLVAAPITTPITAPVLTTTTGGTTGTGITATRGSDPCANLAPTYVVRKPDSDGKYYGIYDGYTVPFPTPWITPSANPAYGYVYDPDAYYFEKELYSVPSHEDHEWLVNVVTTYGCTNQFTGAQGQCIKGIDAHDYFFVGFTNVADYSTVSSDAAGYWGTRSDVQSSVLKCVHVMQGALDYGGFVADTGNDFVFGEVHDPSTHPN